MKEKISVWSIGRVIIVVSLFFGMMLGILVSQPNAKAQPPVYSEPALDGYIIRSSTSYPPPGPGTIDTTDTSLYVGQLKSHTSAVKEIDRSWVSFNTSYIPDNAVIQSAQIKLRLENDFSDTDFNSQVYTSEYVTLDTGDWDVYGSLQGVLLNSASAVVGNWYSLQVSSASVNLTGYSGFMLKSDRDDTEMPGDYEFLTFYSGDSSSAPTMTVVYSVLGTTVSIRLTTGGYVNSTIFADIQDWNLTYDLWCFEFDTVTDSANFTISKANTSWEFQGVTPGCTYTVFVEYVFFEDIYSNIEYRVWFTVPKSNPYTTVHLSLFNAFTGEGFFWENMKVMLCDGNLWDALTAEQLARPDFYVEPEGNYTLRVLDYFGNALVDYSFTANAQDIFLTVPVPYYSWQIFNMNDAPVLMRIYWNNSGSPWEFFVGPHWIIERFLKGGDYSFMVTFYETSGVAGETVYYNRTVPMTGLNASFVYVNGATLSEIVTSVQGIMASQEIITSLVSPSVVLVYENLPIAPAKVRSLSMLGSVSLDPYLVLETTTFQNGTGTDITMGCPYPGDIARSYTIFTDILTFSGPYDAQVLVNTSAGDSLYSSATLPASVVLSGADNITVWSNLTITVFRATAWREVGEYTVTHYATERRYVATLSFNNSMTLDYYQPYWYVAFPANATVDQNSVSVYDLDNDCPLSIRINFEVTAGGIHLTLPYLNSSGARNFRFTYWDLNGTTPTGAPNLVTDSYTTKTLNDHIMKYTSVQWVNPWPQVYAGEIYITLNYSGGDNLLRSSITVIDETTGNALRSSDWLYTGRTLIILTSGVGSVGIGQGRNFGIYFAFNAEITPTEQHDFFFSPIVWNEQSFYIGGVGVSVFLIGIVVMWLLVGYAFWRGKEDWPIFVIPLCVTIIGFYFQGVMT